MMCCSHKLNKQGNIQPWHTPFPAWKQSIVPCPVLTLASCPTYILPDHITCLLRNLYAGQEATVRTQHATTEWFQIRKGVRKGCILSPCLFKLYAEYIMWNAQPDKAQAGITFAGRNINNLRYAEVTTLMAELEEKLKSLVMKMKKESETSSLNSTFRKWRSWHFVPSLHGK